MEGGRTIETSEGAPRGAVISPLLANIYLHYVTTSGSRRGGGVRPPGDMIIVRFADDTIVGFQHRGDAALFLRDLKRLAKFALSLNEEKTRLSPPAGCLDRRP